MDRWYKSIDVPDKVQYYPMFVLALNKGAITLLAKRKPAHWGHYLVIPEESEHLNKLLTSVFLATVRKSTEAIAGVESNPYSLAYLRGYFSTQYCKFGVGFVDPDTSAVPTWADSSTRSRLVHPAPLLACRTVHFLQCSPETHGAVSDRKVRHIHPARFQFQQHLAPALRGFPHPVFRTETASLRVHSHRLPPAHTASYVEAHCTHRPPTHRPIALCPIVPRTRIFLPPDLLQP